MELTDDWFRPDGETVEIQKRVNALNEIMRQFLESAMLECDYDPVLSAEIVLEDVLDAEIVG